MKKVFWNMEIVEIIYWISIPTLRLTENSSKKWVRVTGLLGIFILFPFTLTLAAPLIIYAVIFDMIKDA